jgi:type II secretory pathway pseudopilin PulG
MLQAIQTTLRRKEAAFTLVEMIVSTGMICLIGASTLGALSLFNRNSNTSRLLTAAESVAKSQIELVQVDGPFNPQLGQVPDELAIGTQTDSNVSIYSDPNDDFEIDGTLTTTVTDAGLSVNGNNLNARYITVTVAFTFRGRNYLVKMSTMRVPDV